MLCPPECSAVQAAAQERRHAQTGHAGLAEPVHMVQRLGATNCDSGVVYFKMLSGAPGFKVPG